MFIRLAYAVKESKESKKSKGKQENPSPPNVVVGEKKQKPPPSAWTFQTLRIITEFFP